MNSDFEIQKLPWPSGSANLFVEGGNDFETAFIYSSERDWSSYARGYQVAYQRLLDSWRNDDSSKPDSLAYPIVFLCRQYLELRLKELIQMGQELLSVQENWPRIHNLSELWMPLRPLIEEIWPNDPRDTLDHVESLIEEFTTFDPDSMTFRYPTDRNGKKHFPGFESLSFTRLEDGMAELSSFLDAVHSGCSVYLDHMKSV